MKRKSLITVNCFGMIAACCCNIKTQKRRPQAAFSTAFSSAVLDIKADIALASEFKKSCRTSVFYAINKVVFIHIE
ncbi:hypothetical protein [Chromatium okenii]|uniref:hypothetical protein n=1 Tax=Chromatium okenii TaxID=61644 RepID=UPI00155942DF|nr:hypothetical protein [Chromatium okenii]